jgi:radical SAM superfamily enzyme YgiQ (UPF0313 family)
LIGDPEADKANFDYTLPIGLGYISAVLKQNNHQVNVLNLNHIDGSVDTLIEKEFQNNYDFVITGGLSPFYPHIKSVVESVRRHAPETKIILGGGLISSQPEIMFKMLEPDFGIVGEGEETIIELLDCIKSNNDLNGVNGIIYREPERALKVTNPRQPIKNLDLIPFPDYDGLGLAEFLDHMRPSDNVTFDVFDNPRAYPIIASRSCPFTCTFCYHPLGDKYRRRSVENIMEEVKYAVKRYRVNIFNFYDELFAQNRERLSELCRNIKKFASTIPWEIKWGCSMRVDYLDDDTVKEMKDAGCYFISLGLESYSIPVLESMKKRITPNQIDNALHVCKHEGVTFTGNFIFGDIAETKETYQETLDYWKSHPEFGSSIGLMHIVLYPGSYIYKNAVKKGIIKDEMQFIEDRAKQDWPVPINFTDAMTDKEYQQMTADIIEAAAIPVYYANPLVNIQTKDRHEIHVRCPICKEIVVYKNYHLPKNFGSKIVACRNCRSRFVIPSNRLRLKIFIVKLFGYRVPYRIGKYIYDLSEHLPPYMKIKIKKILAV